MTDRLDTAITNLVQALPLMVRPTATILLRELVQAILAEPRP